MVSLGPGRSLRTETGQGRREAFQRAGPESGKVQQGGEVRARWAALGTENSPHGESPGVVLGRTL